MGCVHSAPRKRSLRVPRPASPPVSPSPTAPPCLQTEQQAPPPEPHLHSHPHSHPHLNPVSTSSPQSDDALPLRDTLVLKQAGHFDQRHEDALKPPSLLSVNVIKGSQSAKLLEGFEQKEAQARAMPDLVVVEKADLRSSKLYDKLKEFEDNDKRAAAEPRLEKTFMQRQRESTAALSNSRSTTSDHMDTGDTVPMPIETPVAASLTRPAT